MKQTLEAAEKRINEILSAREVKAAAFEKNQALAMERVQQAETDMECAVLAEDVEAYQKAAAARSDAKSAAELFVRLSANLETKPLIPAQEYEKLVADLMAEIKAEDNAARAKLRELAKQMRAIGEELAQTVEKGNNLLHVLQHDIFAYRAGAVTQEHGHTTLSRPEKQYDAKGTIAWANVAANHYQATLEE